MPYKIADRAALLPGSGLAVGRASPLAAALLYRGVLSRCSLHLETEVISEEDGEAQAWLRVSDTRLGEHHLVDLSPGRQGTFARIFPKRPAAEMAAQPNHWLAVLHTLSRALGGMCPCCVAEHPTAGWFGELCADLQADLRTHGAQQRGASARAELGAHVAERHAVHVEPRARKELSCAE